MYQPVVDLRTGEQAGYEALARVADWPARSPQPWFAAAAKAGLGGQLEAASLLNALRIRNELGPEQFLAVNIAVPFIDEEAVISVLREQPDLAGLLVELEWPDGGTGLPADADSGGALGSLRVEGLRVACDVVEAGRVELERLERLQPDLVKLDGALVNGAHADPVRDRLIRLVVSMASDMGAVVQGEGVESLDDARHLQVVGVRFAQGWLFGRARPSLMSAPPEVSTWLRASWQETVHLTRTGRLAQQIPVRTPDDPPVGDPVLDDRRADGGNGGWTAEVDGEGRLVSLRAGDGRTVPASRLLRLRAAQDLRAAALRVLASGVERRLAGPVVIAGENGRYLGVTDVDTVMRAVLAEVNGR